MNAETNLVVNQSFKPPKKPNMKVLAGGVVFAIVLCSLVFYFAAPKKNDFDSKFANKSFAREESSADMKSDITVTM
jgi:hypothetical protein